MLNPKHIQFVSGSEILVDDGERIFHYRLANFQERFLARAIDGVIIFIPNIFLPIVFNWLYWSVQQSRGGQATIGQKIMLIQLLSLDGADVSFGQATGRYFADYINYLTCLIAYLFFFFNNKNQCVHDVLTGTIVVRLVAVLPK